MLRFKICDTDVVFLEKLATLLHQMYDPCSVEYMYGPDVLEVSLRSAAGTADVLLTEVTLRGKRSIDLIRRFHAESDPMQIIYMTPRMEHCFDVYDTRHSGFLLKPFTEEHLKKNVDRALLHLQKQKGHSLSIRQGKNLHIVPFVELMRVESRGRMLHFITRQEEIRAYGRLDAVADQLDGRFLRCHKSHLINMDYVRKYTGSGFYLSTGESLPVSQSRQAAARNEFLAYTGLSERELAGKR